MRQTKKERATYISIRSQELALSGKYADGKGIKLALRSEGYEEARGELDSRTKRDLLNQLCKQAQAKGPKTVWPFDLNA